MKALRLIVIGMMLFLANSLQAQFSMSINIPSPPLWGPAGYTAVNYYYLPDVEAYYDVRSSMFIYFSGNAWVHRTYLPPRYRNYDLYGGYKVVMQDYHGNAPYAHFKEHKMKYARGYRGKAQRSIGERPGRGDYGKNNSHGSPSGNQRNDRGRVNNMGHGNDRGDAHNNGKHMKDNHGHGDGNGKKK